MWGDTVETQAIRSGFTLMLYHLLVCDPGYVILPFSGLVSSLAKWRWKSLPCLPQRGVMRMKLEIETTPRKRDC